MAKNKCRVCGSEFFEKPLLTYNDMPANAQYFPDASSLKNDKGINLTICQCSGCGLVQLDNEPVDYYKEVIRAAAVSEEMRLFREKQFSQFVDKYKLRGKKVIEIGCGNGEYLGIMQKTGVKAYGIEEANDSVEKCKKNGLKVMKGFVEDPSYRIKDAPFDAFFILNFLEHLPKINLTLKGIYNNLAEGGIGLVEVPNFDMEIQKKLFSEFTRDHLFYFTQQTLRTTLELNGFEVVECKVVWHDYIISAVVRKRKKLELDDFYKQQEKIKKEINEYISKFKNGRVAVWGAGHQALAAIALFGIAKKIKYVVDSAKFKQGKYTPATHVPIVAPEMLDKEPVDAVIVMAASYSDEVARVIRQKHGNRIKVAILRDYGLEEIKP